MIRTAGNPLKSHPSRPLLVAVFAIVAVAAVLPYTGLGKLLQFTPLPLSLLAAIAFLAVTYLFWCKSSSPGSIAGTRCYDRGDGPTWWRLQRERLRDVWQSSCHAPVA